jgi:nucleotide-binding universal stress UspA family protein
MFASKNILVPTDFSEPADCALQYAKDLARTNGATLHLVHAIEMVTYPTGWTYPGIESIESRQYYAELSDKELQKRAEALHKEGFSVQIQTLTSGTASDGIAEYAALSSINLICIATHGRSGLGHFFLGSTTERLLRKTHCPVLVVRRKED